MRLNNNILSNLNALYKVCKLFALAYDRIDQNTSNKQEITRVVEKWFFSRAYAIYSAVDGHDKYKQLVLLGLCATLFGRSTEPLHNAKEIYVKSILEKSWDDIYGNYVMHIGSRDTMFSADELSCLATHWNVQLLIEEKSKLSTNFVANPSLTVTLANESGNRWSVSADDALLELVSQEQDDKFKTLILLNELVKEMFTSTTSKLDPSASFKTIRKDLITKKNVTGELLLQPINMRNSLSFKDSAKDNEIEKKQSIETQNNSVLWSFKHRNPAFTTSMRINLVGGVAASTLLESGAAIAGLYGVEEGMVFARAVQAGRVAGTSWQAAHFGTAVLRAATNPFTLVPIAVFEAGMLSRRKLNEFGESIKKALELYKEAAKDNDKEKLKQVEEILRAEIGEGNNRRWQQTRLAIWLQASNDQYALIYYILGDIASKLNRKDALAIFEKACYYAKDEDIKWLSLFGVARERWSELQKIPSAMKIETPPLQKILNQNIKSLQETNQTMVGMDRTS